MSKKFKAAAHGIDLFAPGGLTKLFALHRGTFGDAVMETAAGEAAGTPAPAPAGEAPATGAPTPAVPAQEPTDWKAESRKWEQRAKENLSKVNELTPAAARLAEIEESNKTAEQKAAERVAALEESDRSKDAAIAERDAKLLRYQIAAAKGLDLEAAERLRGTTKEEIEADADDFKKKFGSNRPGEVPGAGHRGTDVSSATPGMGRLQAAYAANTK